MTISFSGLNSGLDTTSWITSLTALKQAKVTTLQKQQETIQTSLTALNGIKSYFSTFRSMLTKITDSKFNIASMDLFARNIATSSNVNVLTATATTDAVEGSYNIKVSQLASKTEASSGVKKTVTIENSSTATTDTYLKNLGIKAGAIDVSPDSSGITVRLNITESDTIGSFIKKLENIGVEASFNEKTSVFNVNISTSDINDIGRTGVVSGLKLQGVNKGYETPASLIFQQEENYTEYATGATKLSDIGVGVGTVTIKTNDSTYSLELEANDTIQDFIDALTGEGIQASIDNGVLRIENASILNDGTTNLLNALGLGNPDVSGNTQTSGALSYSTTVTSVTLADGSTLLKDLGVHNGTITVDKDGETLSFTINENNTLQNFLDALNNAGISASINDGVLDIENIEITNEGTTGITSALGVGGGVVDNVEQQSGMLTYTTVISTTSIAEGNTQLSTYGVSNGNLVVNSNGATYTISVTSTMTFDDLVNAFAAKQLEASFANGVLNLGDIEIDTANTTTNIVSKLGIGEEGVSYMLQESGALHYTATVTNTQVATATTKLNEFGVAAGTIKVKHYDNNGNIVQSNVTIGANMTFQGLINALSSVNVTATLDNGVLAIDNANITDVGTTNIKSALGISDTTVASNLQKSTALKYATIETFTTTADASTTLAYLGIATGNLILSDKHNSYTVAISTSETLGTVLNRINDMSGFTATMVDGNITLSGMDIISDGGTNFTEALGLSLSVKEAEGYYQSSNPLKYSTIEVHTTTADATTTLEHIVVANGQTVENGTLVVNDSDKTVTITVNKTDTIDTLMRKFRESGLEGVQINLTNGQMTLEGVNISSYGTTNLNNVFSFTNVVEGFHAWSDRMTYYSVTTETTTVSHSDTIASIHSGSTLANGTLKVATTHGTFNVAFTKANETFDSLIAKFNAIDGVTATLADGVFSIYGANIVSYGSTNLDSVLALSQGNVAGVYSWSDKHYVTLSTLQTVTVTQSSTVVGLGTGTVVFNDGDNNYTLNITATDNIYGSLLGKINGLGGNISATLTDGVFQINNASIVSDNANLVNALGLTKTNGNWSISSDPYKYTVAVTTTVTATSSSTIEGLGVGRLVLTDGSSNYTINVSASDNTYGALVTKINNLGSDITASFADGVFSLTHAGIVSDNINFVNALGLTNYSDMVWSSESNPKTYTINTTTTVTATASSTITGLSTGAVIFHDGTQNYTINITASDRTFNDIMTKINNLGSNMNASFANGVLTITNANIVYDGANFINALDLDNYSMTQWSSESTPKTYTINVTTTATATASSTINGLGTGNVIFNDGNQNYTITITGSDNTFNALISKINNLGSNMTASFSNGVFSITNASIVFDGANFIGALDLDNYSAPHWYVTSDPQKYTVTTTTTITANGSTTLSSLANGGSLADGTIQVGTKHGTFNISVTASTETFNSLIDKFNAIEGVSAQLRDGVFTISGADIKSYGTTNLATVLGMNQGTVAGVYAWSDKFMQTISSTMTTTVNPNSTITGLGTGSLVLSDGSNNYTISITASDKTYQALINKINNAGGAFSASLTDGVFALQSGSVVSDGVNFVNALQLTHSEVTGWLASSAPQKYTRTIYSTTTLAGTSTISGLAAGKVVLTNGISNYTVTVAASDTFNGLVTKINNLGAGITAAYSNGVFTLNNADIVSEASTNFQSALKLVNRVSQGYVGGGGAVVAGSTTWDTSLESLGITSGVIGISNGSTTNYVNLEIAQGPNAAGFLSNYVTLTPTTTCTTAAQVQSALAAGGNATIAISTVDALQGLCGKTIGAGKTVILAADIDASGIANWTGFIISGGTFDGQGHTISGLKITSGDSKGFVTNLASGTICNVGLINVNISGGNNVGALVGSASGGNVFNCYAKGTVMATGTVGGLIGYISGNVDISSSYTEGKVQSSSANAYAGGLIGNFSYGTVNVTGSHSSATITSTGNNGGLVGCFASFNRGLLNISNSHFDGSISGSNSVGCNGGIVGYASGDRYTTFNITNTYSTGNISGRWSGGLVGYLDNNYYDNFNCNASGCSVIGNLFGYVELEYDDENEWYNIRHLTLNNNSYTGSIYGSRPDGSEPYDIDVTGSGNSQVTTSALYTSLGLTPGVVTGGSNVVSTYLTNHGQIYNSTSDTHVNVNSSTQQWTPDMNTELGEMGITDGTFNVVNDGSITAIIKIDTNAGDFTVINNITPDVTVTTAAQFNSAISSYNTIGIGSVAALQRLAAYVNSGNNCSGKTFVLTTDLDLSTVANWSSIGGSSYQFAGTFDGQGHTISNLSQTNNAEYSGLFGRTTNAVIRNVNMTNVNITGKSYVGGLVGYMYGTSSSVSNCNVSGSVATSTQSYVGLIAGFADGNFTNCHTSGTVHSGWDDAGGLIGYIYEHGTVISCSSSATVTSNRYNTGGLIGEVRGTSYIDHCWASGDVTAGLTEGTNTSGGLIGAYYAYSGSSYQTFIVSDSYATGVVQTASCNNISYGVGGFIGNLSRNSNNNCSIQFTNCYAFGGVANSGTRNGDFVGNVYYSGVSFTNCGAINKGHAGYTNGASVAALSEAQAATILASVQETPVTMGDLRDKLATYGLTLTSSSTASGTVFSIKSAGTSITSGSSNLVTKLFNNGTLDSRLYSDVIGEEVGTFVSAPAGWDMTVATNGTLGNMGVTNGSKFTVKNASGTAIKTITITATTTMGSIKAALATYGITVMADPTSTGTVFSYESGNGNSLANLSGNFVTKVFNHSTTVYNYSSAEQSTEGVGTTLNNVQWDTALGDMGITDGTVNVVNDGSITAVLQIKTSESGISLMQQITPDVNCTSAAQLSAAFGSYNTIGIGSVEALQQLAAIVNGGNYCDGKVFVLTADLDLSGVANWDSIGNSMSGTIFRGTFDGQGHTISNLTQLSAPDAVSGLFGRVGGGTGVIRNVNMTNVNITTSTQHAGGLVGYGTGCTIINCNVSGNVTGSNYTGVAIGELANKATVINCHTSGNAYSTWGIAGGLVGGTEAGNGAEYLISITSCSSSATVAAYNYGAGGLVGHLTGNNVIDHCYATGNATSEVSTYDYGYAGGLVAFANSSTGTITISNSYATGVASAINRFTGSNNNDGVGGFVGQIFSTSNINISNCYSFGGVNVSGSKCGDFIGNNQSSNATLTNCIAVNKGHAGTLNGLSVTSISEVQGETALAALQPTPVSMATLRDTLATYGMTLTSSSTDAGTVFSISSSGASLSSGSSNLVSKLFSNGHFTNTISSDVHETITTDYSVNNPDWNTQLKTLGIGSGTLLIHNGATTQTVTVNTEATLQWVKEQLAARNITMTMETTAGGVVFRANSGSGSYLSAGSSNIYTELFSNNVFTSTISSNVHETVTTDYSVNNPDWNTQLKTLGIGTGTMEIFNGTTTHTITVNTEATIQWLREQLAARNITMTMESTGNGTIFRATGANGAYISGGTSPAIDELFGYNNFVGNITSDVHKTVNYSQDVGNVDWNTRLSDLGVSAGTMLINDGSIYTTITITSSVSGPSNGAGFMTEATHVEAQVTVTDAASLASALSTYTTIGIANAAVLAQLSTIVNGGNACSGKTFVLTSDIDLSAYAGGEGWNPIGSATGTKFSGSLCGNGHVIRNLTCNRSEGVLQALIGRMENGEVRDLGIEDCNILGAKTCAGLIGQLNSAASSNVVTNCYTTGTIVSVDSEDAKSGGLIGNALTPNAVITNCSSSCNVVSSGSYTGGLIGTGKGQITNCYATGDVSSNGKFTGGLIGYTSGGDITNCYATGEVTGGNNCVGGLIGAGTCNISNCFAVGDVNAENAAFAGGLVGQWCQASISSNGKSITNSYSYGNVTAGYMSGGLVGNIGGTNYNDTMSITNCHAMGNVSVSGYIAGGLVGQFANSSSGNTITIKDCYSTGNVNAPTGTGNIIGYVGNNDTLVSTGCYHTGIVNYGAGVAVGTAVASATVNVTTIAAQSTAGMTTLGQLRDAMAAQGITLAITSTGAGTIITASAGQGKHIAEGTSNIIDHLFKNGRLTNSLTSGTLEYETGGDYIHNADWDTLVSASNGQFGIGVTNGSKLVVKDGAGNNTFTYTVTATTTMGSIKAALATQGITLNVDTTNAAGSVFSYETSNGKYLADLSGNFVSMIFNHENKVYNYASSSAREITYSDGGQTHDADWNTKLKDLGITNGTITIKNIQTGASVGTININNEQTMGWLRDELAAKGVTLQMNVTDAGAVSFEYETNGTRVESNASNIVSKLFNNNYTTYDSTTGAQLNTLFTESVTYNAALNTKLGFTTTTQGRFTLTSDGLGCVGGKYVVCKDGVNHTLSISTTSTLADVNSQIASYGITIKATTTAEGTRFYIDTSSDVYLKSATGAGASDFVDKLFGNTAAGIYEYTSHKDIEYEAQVTYNFNGDTKLTERGTHVIHNPNGTTTTVATGATSHSISNGIYDIVQSDGTRITKTITADTTVDDFLNTLRNAGFTAELVGEGVDTKIRIKGSGNQYLAASTSEGTKSNVVSVLFNNSKDTTYNYSSELDMSTSGDQTFDIDANTELSQLGISQGAFRIISDGRTIVSNVTEGMTFGDLKGILEGYNINMSFVRANDGIHVKLTSDDNSYLEAATGAGASNIITKLGLVTTGTQHDYGSNTFYTTTTVTETISATGSMNLSDFGITTGQYYVVQNGERHALNIGVDDTFDSLINTLRNYGINANLVETESGVYLDITANGDSYIEAATGSGSSNIAAILASSTNKIYDYNSTITITTTQNQTVSAGNNELLSSFGITSGEYYIYSNGVRTTANISNDETFGSLADTLSNFGIRASLVETAEGVKLVINGDGNSYIAKSNSANASNIADHFFNNDKDSMYNYETTIGITHTNTLDIDATEDTLISKFDHGSNKSAGNLSLTINGKSANIAITADETFGSLIEKFAKLGVTATINDGKFVIQSGYNDVTINNSSTSKLVSNLGLTLNNDLGGYSSSTESLISRETIITDKTLSVANYADFDTQMGLLNISNGLLSIFRNGVRATVEVNSDETFGDLRTRIRNAFSTGDLDIKFTDGKLEIFSWTEGVNVEAGTTTDSSNFYAICGLTKSDDRVTSSRELYKVNGSSKITGTGLFRNGNVTAGTFTVGGATFTIDNNTTLNDVISMINSSDTTNATAYWDSVDGKLVLKSRTTGYSLINIEAGTSNFTDILGLTATDRDGGGNVITTRLLSENQELGANAIFEINGTRFTSSSNLVGSDVSKLNGITLDLKGVSGNEEVTITIERDSETVANTVSDIVDAYNELISNVDQELAKTGSLSDQSALKLIRNQLRSLVTSSIGASGVFKNLSQIGISVDAASAGNISTDINNLNFDREKFINSFKADGDSMKKLLIGTEEYNGIFVSIDNILDRALNSVSGYFDSATSAYNKQLSNLSDKITRANAAIESYRARLENKFSSMDLLIGKIQQQYSSFLGT